MLPETIKYIIQLCNAVFKRGFFAPQEDRQQMEGSTNYNDSEA